MLFYNTTEKNWGKYVIKIGENFITAQIKAVVPKWLTVSTSGGRPSQKSGGVLWSLPPIQSTHSTNSVKSDTDEQERIFELHWSSVPYFPCCVESVRSLAKIGINIHIRLLVLITFNTLIDTTFDGYYFYKLSKRDFHVN